MDSYSPSRVDFLTNCLVVGTKFLITDDIVVVAAEDDATVSLITNVSMVQQMERLFALMDSNSLSVDFRFPGAKREDS